MLSLRNCGAVHISGHFLRAEVKVVPGFPEWEALWRRKFPELCLPWLLQGRGCAWGWAHPAQPSAWKCWERVKRWGCCGKTAPEPGQGRSVCSGH